MKDLDSKQLSSLLILGAKLSGSMITKKQKKERKNMVKIEKMPCCEAKTAKRKNK